MWTEYITGETEANNASTPSHPYNESLDKALEFSDFLRTNESILWTEHDRPPYSEICWLFLVEYIYRRHL